MVRIDYFKMLQEITTKFVIVVNYKNDNNIESCLLTNCSEYFSEAAGDKPEDIYCEKLVGRDIINNKWVEIDFNDNNTCYIWNDFNILKVDFTFEMLFAEDEDIQVYNERVISDFKDNIKRVEALFLKIENDYNILNSENFKKDFFNKANLVNFFEQKHLEQKLLFCALLSTSVEDMNENNILNIKPNWLALIEKHSHKIYIELEKELDLLDRRTANFEHEQEEINIIKTLIAESIKETAEEIESAKTLDELFGLYPPLMLPYPYDIQPDTYKTIQDL